MEERSIARGAKPLVPEWLVNRQLSERLFQLGALPEGLDAEDLIQILGEENSYGGVYSPELLTMLNGVDRAFVTCLNCDPIFYREIFETWYFETFAPNIFDYKLPIVIPKIEKNQGNGGAVLLMLLVAVVAAGWFLFTSLVDITSMWKMLHRLQDHGDEEQQSAETVRSEEP